MPDCEHEEYHREYASHEFEQVKNGFGDAALVLFCFALVGTEKDGCNDIDYYKVCYCKFHAFRICLLLKTKEFGNPNSLCGTSWN